MNSTPHDFPALCREFPFRGEFLSARPHGNGHINETYAVTLRESGVPVRYILQRINHRIFRDVPRLMDNIARVSAQVSTKVRSEPPLQALTLIHTRRGETFHLDATGGHWRAYVFVEGASTHDVVSRPELARAAAFAFGRFQQQLADLPGPRLHETIPHFHDTRRRFSALERATATDPAGRAAASRAEIEFARQREPFVDTLLNLQRQGDAPERITHNDTKANNVMLDDATGEAVCVIDLDTVMPGLSLYDFGDMVRSATNAAAEDETDLSRVHARLPIFDALVSGYLAATRALLTPAEISHLVRAGQLMTFEVGVRFLTDHLEGDVYFRIKRPGHNLDRARNQFALVASMEAQREQMEAIVRQHLSSR